MSSPFPANDSAVFAVHSAEFTQCTSKYLTKLPFFPILSSSWLRRPSSNLLQILDLELAHVTNLKGLLSISMTVLNTRSSADLDTGRGALELLGHGPVAHPLVPGGLALGEAPRRHQPLRLGAQD